MRDYQQDTRSFGLWAKFTWDFLDDLTLDGGVRYNWERKDFTIERTQFLFGNPFPPNAADLDDTWHTPTGNLTLTYHLNEGVSAFAKSRITRSGRAGSS